MELASAPRNDSVSSYGQPEPDSRPETPIISVHRLTKRFARRPTVRTIVRFGRRPAPVPVVQDLTLDVMPGEVFGLLGPNGAGKTTIFKMLATMIAPDGGTARVAGLDVVRDAASVREVLASVPSDERSLNWRLSAAQNLALFAALHRIPHADTVDRVSWALACVSLAETGAKRVAEFSSGMRQRLLIARALLTQPRILLLDEPTRTLDPISARELRRFLRDELVDGLGCTILLATHNTDEAFGFCDRVGILDAGRLLAIGPAAELTARFGEERYRILTRSAAQGEFAALEARGLLRQLPGAGVLPDGWWFTECTIGGGPNHSAEVVASLVESGVAVARLERIEPSLADLISRIISAGDTDHTDA